MMFDGEHKVIPIKGIARAGADSLCEDGAMNEVIGLEYKDGSYVPYSGKITNPSTLPIHEDIQEIYVHKTSSGDNVILKIGGLLFWDEKADFDKGFNEDLGGFDEIVTDGEAKDVEFIGNVMCISTDKAVNKYIFRDGNYVDFALLIDKLPKVKLRVTLGIPEKGDMIGKKYIYHQEGVGVDKFSLTDRIPSQMTKAIGDITNEGGLTGYFLACVAYRLTTGEYIAASAPVLLARPMNSYDKKICDILTSNPSSDKTSMLYDDTSLVVTNIAYEKDYAKTERNLLWNDTYVKDEDDNNISIFYKYNGKNHYAANLVNGVPILASTARQNGSTSSYLCDAIETFAAGNKLQYLVTANTEGEDYNDIIDSACIFMSQEISPFKNWYDDDIEDVLINGQKFYDDSIAADTNPMFSPKFRNARSYFPILKSVAEIEKEVKDLRNMYRVCDISFAKLSNPEIDWSDVNTKDKLGDYLITLESLPISAFLNNHIYDGLLDSYNQRLHIYDYKQKMFDGHDVFDFAQIGGIGQYNGIGTIYADEAYIKVYGKSNLGKYSVVKKAASITEEGIESLSIPQYWNPIVSYPDKNAYRMEVYYRNGTQWYGTGIDLVPSISGGYAYAMLNTLGHVSYINMHDNMFQKLDSAPDINSSNNILNQNNVLKISDTYNPNYFPPANTYTIGNGSIIGIASLSISLSQDTFGQYPLLVFCTDGIYSMGVDTTGTGVYNNIAPFSREVCINRNTICEIDGAVLFASSKGLLIATAQGVDEFIPTLNGEPKHLPQDSKDTKGLGLALYKEAINHELAVQLTGCISKDDFIDFLSDSKTVVTYASEKNNIVVYNPSKPYCYWIDIPTRNTTKLPVGIKMDNNNYPNEEYVTAENRIMMFKHLSAEGDVQCVLQSRPIKLGGKHTSHIRVVARGYFNSADAGKYAVMLVLGSYDGVNWQPLGSMQKPFAGGFHDLGCVVDRVSCEYLMVIVSGSLSSNSHIDGIELTKENKYINKLK
jgi:hypothetical protein